MDVSERNEVPEASVEAGMRFEIDVPIEVADGTVLRADVYRPVEDGTYPVIMSHGPYAKNLPFQQGFTGMWEAMVKQFPEVAEGTSNRHQAFEVADPEKWVPHGYAVVRVDSRGAARSPGFIDCFGPQETHDLHDCIEWAGTQPWSNGKVGLSGISYYAVNQWQAAATQPEHLAAICPWEGAADWYRDANNHGGIPSPFVGRWYPVQVEAVQHGLGARGPRNEQTGMLIAGDEELPDSELERNRGDILAELYAHPLIDQYWHDRSADLSKVEVPLLSAGNWGGQGLHLRGNLEGYLHSSSEKKWLEVHGHPHWALYYTDYANDLQRRFFDCFLKGEGDWEETQPPVQLQVRHPGERFVQRAEQEWPLARTEWKTLHLDPAGSSLGAEVPAASSAEYQAFGDGLTFLAEPFAEETEITGPLAAQLWISNSTEDTDVFLALHLFDPDGKEVRFHGATEPKQSISQGWLRASHRKLDQERSLPYQPVHPHDERQPLTPGEIYRLEIEVWPTCIVAPAGYRLGLSVLGRDWDHGGEGLPSHLGYELRGSGLNVHDDPVQRPPQIYDGRVTVYGGPEHPSQLLVPFVPPAE
jgi:uncharacterized protein